MGILCVETAGLQPWVIYRKQCSVLEVNKPESPDSAIKNRDTKKGEKKRAEARKRRSDRPEAEETPGNR
jgi:hypothetical protein